ncbi:hypothetical protein FG386_001640 [Cryptosporidium ryanae]|uniref:uncharacterized protein n=1 Tax=Cryptosporidium ryanae TaxID=515981 RepID=UPI00351A1AEC|nr:hypothetical protein FG386_001640 [Cryptosporidium ryanae]
MSGSFFIFPFMIENRVILLFLRILLFFFTINLVYNYLLCLNTSPGYASSIATHNYIDYEHMKIGGESFECTDVEIGTKDVGEHIVVCEANRAFFQNNNKTGNESVVKFPHNKEEESFIFDEDNYVGLKECTKCGALKYPRTHHCSICNRCILNMDHHCPWIGQCVGLHNRKYFILFLVWSFLSCLQISLFALPMMIILISALLGDVKSINMTNSILSDNFTFQGLLLSAMLSISYALGTGVLLFFHIHLLLTNQSTIEYHQNTSMKKFLESKGKNWINKYDKGTLNNVKEVMGTTKFPFLLFPCL